jgi:5-methyltetrahydrofolate--homocysteine methyltransferase
MARKNALQVDWQTITPAVPFSPGLTILEDYPLETLRPYIDWTFFFHAWRMPGKFPEIFDDPLKGEESRKLYEDASTMLDEMISKKMVRARGVVGLFPANSTGEDVKVFSHDNPDAEIGILHFLRNQEKKDEGVPNLSLADFIAPEGTIRDYIGLFAVTAGIGIEEWIGKYEAEHDHYRSILLKILSDRLAEAFAEQLHERVRKEFWGYDPRENLTISRMLKEEYNGIRPAPGYPACPEHSEKRTVFDLLNAETNTGISLTENFAMYPAASVCGYYFSHPFSRYFNLGKLQDDQVVDYAIRKGINANECRRLLNPNLF